MLDIEVADGAEHHCADEVNEQIRHGVVQSDIQIAAEAQLLPVDGDGGDTVDGDGNIFIGRIQHDGGNGAHHRVLLHVHVEETIHAELEELPQHTHRHGEAESRQRHVNRGELELDPAVAVENVDQREACGGAEKTGGGVQHGVPVGKRDEVALQLAQYLGGEDEQQDNDLQCGGKLDAEVLLDEEGQHEQHQYQQADEGTLIFAADDGGHQRSQHNEPQNQIHGEHGGLAADGRLQVAWLRGKFGMSFHRGIPFYWYTARKWDGYSWICFPIIA